MDLPAGEGALSAAEDDLEHEPAAAGVVVRRSRARGGVRREVVAGRRTVGNAVRPGWFGQDATRNRVGGRAGSGIPERCLLDRARRPSRSQSRRPYRRADVVGGLEPGAGAEEIERLELRQRRHGILDFPPDAQQLAARHQETEVRAGLEQRRELRGGVHQLLEVVEQQEQLALADVLGQAALGPQRALRASRGIRASSRLP